MLTLVHDVKNQSINEQEHAVLGRCVNSIFYFNKKQQKWNSNVLIYHCSTCIEDIYLYQNCTDSVVLIWSNVIWNIRNEVDKHLSELNKLTLWCVTSASGFMEWYAALLIKDCRYFWWYSKINLMKGKFFFGQYPK